MNLLATFVIISTNLPLSMERAEYLLLKLLEQLRRNESKEQLLNAVKLIQEEIEKSFSAPEPVSVSVSSIPAFIPPVEEAPIEEEQKEYAVLQINEEEIDWESEENDQMILSDIDEEEDGEDVEDEQPEQIPAKEATIAQTILSKFLTPPPVDALLNPEFVEEEPQSKQEIPSAAIELKTETVSSELHQKWNEPSPELMNRFSEAPIKDLKKAIGINDRYRFINELFKGDETMFERSIKTINDFSIFPEAEFWVRRELKTKLGWNAEDVLVQQFDQLVRRRFS